MIIYLVTSERPVEYFLSKMIYQSNDHEMLQYRPTSPETSTESKRDLEFQQNECVRILAPNDIYSTLDISKSGWKVNIYIVTSGRQTSDIRPK